VAKPKYKAGDVIWARVADRSGVVKPEPRPILVVFPPKAPAEDLLGLAISTREELDPEDPRVEMPWDAATGSTTGLYRWCAVVLLWAVRVPFKDIVERSGSAFFQQVSEKAKEARFWRQAKGGR
jgi:hypothetical protein